MISKCADDHTLPALTHHTEKERHRGDAANWATAMQKLTGGEGLGGGGVRAPMDWCNESPTFRDRVGDGGG